ncbi:MAG: thiamine phosphate synthase, partial [Actinomycetota bacterium]
PGTGIDLVRLAARETTKPWFISGGMNAETLGEIVAAGGRGIVVVRAITAALDPAAAAKELRAALP